MTTQLFRASTLEAREPDPSKHVKYTLGMLLGVDDFNQDFAYLIGRDRWFARDAIGYGTLNGLHVTWESSAKGPRIVVTSGTALTPRGQLVCVKPAQCANVNDWIAANKKDVAALLASPVAATLPLYLTLCYRDCPVDRVPIPGEPCRSEDELLVASRLVDDFSLELRLRPPDQTEEDTLRSFVQWLRMLAFSPSGPYATVDQFEAALHSSVGIGSPVMSPLPSPLPSPVGSPLCMPGFGVSFQFASPIAGLKLNPALASEYYRAAFRIWVDEIRPCVHAICAGGGGCCAKHDSGAPSADECLLLARINVPIVAVGANEWRASDTLPLTIDESRRPKLAHLRLLQEMILTSGPGAGAGGAPRSAVVAAGIVPPRPSDPPPTNNLVSSASTNGRLILDFDDYDTTHAYVVKAMAVFDPAVTNPTIAFFDAQPSGLILRVSNGATPVPQATLQTMHFMVEISRYA